MGMTTNIKPETIAAIIQVAVQTHGLHIDLNGLKEALIGAGLPDNLNTFYLAMGIRRGIWNAQSPAPAARYEVA